MPCKVYKLIASTRERSAGGSVCQVLAHMAIVVQFIVKVSSGSVQGTVFTLPWLHTATSSLRAHIACATAGYELLKQLVLILNACMTCGVEA